MGTLTVANDLLGLALGPFVVGILADHLGLLGALQLSPFVYVVAALALIAGKRAYPAGMRRLATLQKGPESLGATEVTDVRSS